jgi:PIN domain nuclease of toxin-antitoxin system
VIVLDTHAWVWWVAESPKLSSPARAAIGEAPALGVSVMSCWEVAMLVAKGRLGLSVDVSEWIENALARPRVRLLPLDPVTAVASTRLPGEFHDDPVDRILAATCLQRGLPLVTRDRRIHKWRQIQVIW